jgi:hypothetical protein
LERRACYNLPMLSSRLEALPSEPLPFAQMKSCQP